MKALARGLAAAALAVAALAVAAEGDEDPFAWLEDVQGEKALGVLDHGVHGAERDPYGPGSFPRPFLPEEAAQ